MKNRKQYRRKQFLIFHSPLSILRFKRGFTLIEVLLASFIFMSVVTIAIGSFTSQITLQSSSEAQRNVQQAAQAIVEAISRDVRTIETFAIGGSTASCSGLYPDCGDRLEFTLLDGTRKDYRFQSGAVLLCNVGCSSANTLNDPERVEVTDFFVEGLEPNTDPTLQLTQPFVVVHLSLQTPFTGRAEDHAELEIRTMVTSRLFDKYR